MRTGDPQDIPSGGACAIQLPLGPLGPKAARAFVTRTMRTLNLPTDHIDAAELSVSELGTNAYLHVGDRPAVPPEIWIWARTHPAPELAFSVFDASRTRLPNPSIQHPSMLAEHGNGLGIVTALASDTNSHFTRSRLSGTPVPGKSVWFTQALPASWPAAEHPIPEAIAATRLLVALRTRGINSDRHRDHTGLIAITAGKLTVWVDAKSYFWREGHDFTHRPLVDLHETVEAIISRVDASPSLR
ncbi:ATP-binding protein [Actinomadura sp. SCN-SB]|uniref:ATP-binding protein n=1 Tax=Actinomadura sp. SCN-SB TaxID=3373092 RepID=UPI003752252C